MYFIEGEIYHIYNRGNRKQIIFHSKENYMYFLQKVNEFLFPRCMMLNWCLMPNHFHFLVYATLASTEPVATSIIPMQQLSQGIRYLLSSYAKGFNKQMKMCGNVFQQKTKAKCISNFTGHLGAAEVTGELSTIAFHYIHQNPVSSGLVSRIEDWEFSSFRDYAGLRNGKLCNRLVALQLLNIAAEDVYGEAYRIIPRKLESEIFLKHLPEV